MIAVCRPGTKIALNEGGCEIVALDVEIWPTSIVCPPGYRLAPTVMGKGYEYDVPGRMLHDDPKDRPEAEFGGVNTLHTGLSHPYRVRQAPLNTPRASPTAA